MINRKSGLNLACLVLLLCLRPADVFSQLSLTLDECMELALENNVNIKNADNDLLMARYQEKSAFTRYFPSVSATGIGFMADKGLLEMDMGGQSLSKMKDGVLGGVTAVMPVFAGGQIVYGNKLAKINTDASQLMRHRAEDDVCLTVERYFWQSVMLKEKLCTLDAVQGQLEQISSDVEAAVTSGIANRNDLLLVQLRENETRSMAIAMKNALKISLNLLSQCIGHPADSIDVVWAMDEGMPASPDSLYCSPEASLMLTTEYKLLDSRVDASRLQYKMSVGKNLPAVVVGGGYVYDNLMDRDHSFFVGGVTVSVPLTKWWSGSHDMKIKKLKVCNAENELADKSELLLIKMQNMWNALTESYEQVKISLESIKQANENLRLQMDYYKAGTCTMSDLLEAQTLFRQSHDRYVESYAQYEVKKREYLLATGR